MKEIIKGQPAHGKGYLIKTRSGKTGRTYHSQDLVRGKVQVYLDGQQQNILVDPDNLEVVGFVD
jgi:hypothetical protein